MGRGAQGRRALWLFRPFTRDCTGKSRPRLTAPPESVSRHRLLVLPAAGRYRARQLLTSAYVGSQPRRSAVSFPLPPLPYAHDALAPYMSKETLEFHHDKHHLAYVENGNKAMAGTPYEKLSLEEICKKAFAEKN